MGEISFYDNRYGACKKNDYYLKLTIVRLDFFLLCLLFYGTRPAGRCLSLHANSFVGLKIMECKAHKCLRAKSIRQDLFVLPDYTGRDDGRMMQSDPLKNIAKKEHSKKI